MVGEIDVGERPTSRKSPALSRAHRESRRHLSRAIAAARDLDAHPPAASAAVLRQHRLQAEIATSPDRTPGSSGIDTTAMMIGKCRSAAGGRHRDESRSSSTLSMPDFVSTPVKTRPPRRLGVTIIIAAAPWLVSRSRCCVRVAGWHDQRDRRGDHEHERQRHRAR